MYPIGRPEMGLILFGLVLQSAGCHGGRLHFERSILLRSRIGPSALGDGRLLNGVANSPAVVGGRIGLVKGHRDRIFLNDSVGIAIDAGIDTDGEEVLVIGSEDSGCQGIS